MTKWIEIEFNSRNPEPKFDCREMNSEDEIDETKYLCSDCVGEPYLSAMPWQVRLFGFRIRRAATGFVSPKCGGGSVRG